MGSVKVMAMTKSSALIKEMPGAVASAEPVVKLRVTAAKAVSFNAFTPVVKLKVYVVLAFKGPCKIKYPVRSKGLYSKVPFTLVVPTFKVTFAAVSVEGSISFENPILRAPKFTGTAVAPLSGKEPRTVGAAVSAAVPVVNSVVYIEFASWPAGANSMLFPALAPPNTFKRCLVLAANAPELNVPFKVRVAEVLVEFKVTVSMAEELTSVSTPWEESVNSFTWLFRV
jgi:hypothetical protein